LQTALQKPTVVASVGNGMYFAV